MITYLTHDQIDFEKWDACIDQSPNGILYAWSWYLNMTCPGWDALIEDDYLSVMPLPWRKKMGVHYVYQPFFVQQLGVFSTRSLSAEVTRRFLDAIPRKFQWVNIHLNTYNGVVNRKEERVIRRVNCELDLIHPYETLYKGYSQNIRRNIKKAARQEVFITPHGQPEVIIKAFQDNKGKEVNAFSPADYLLLKHLIYVGIHKGLVQIRCAYTRENNFCAGIIFFRSANKFIFLFSGATSEARENGAMALLVDDFIRQWAGNDLVLDFEGSSQPDLARFYMGFGSKECVFLQIQINRMPPVLRSLANLLGKIPGA
ncbi:MAG: hypothetical protein R6U64_02910 [Bacteroidales bacterium]